MNDLPPPALVQPADAPVMALAWRELPSLPEGTGVAGAFVGVLGEALFLAGGAAFPDGPPSRGGLKQFTARVHLLAPDASGKMRWSQSPQLRLPRPIGYGAAVPDKDGLILLGGCDATVCHVDVTRIRLDASGILVSDPLPSLPVRLANFSAARVGDRVIVAGGQETPDGPATNHCFVLNLSSDTPRWDPLPAWPGSPRLMAVGVSLGQEFVLISGKNPQPGRLTDTLTDAFALNPVTRIWRRLAEVGRPVESAVPVMAATGVALDAARLLVFGGGAYHYLQRSEQLGAELEAARAQRVPKAELAARERARAPLTHPGFQSEVRLYDARTDQWQRVGLLPFARPPVNTTAVRWRDAVVLPSGEILPGKRTPAVWQAILLP